jgi:hypothetical protein
VSDWITFNIHNRVHMRVKRSAPTSSLFVDMFDPFLTQEQQERYDITVTDEDLNLTEGALGEVHGATEFHYSTKGITLDDMEVQIGFSDDGIYVSGKRELLVVVLPIVDHLMVAKNAGMVHALTVAYKGQGLCMPAWGGSGKTSTMAKLVKMDGFSFMGDDWAFITEDEHLLAYAKPMFVKPYHRSLYPHIFAKRRKPLVPRSLAKPIHSVTTLVHPYVTKFPQIARITRRWSPEHIMVMPRDAFPGHQFAHDVPLKAGLFVERFETESRQPFFEEKTTEWMVSQLIGNFFSELSLWSRTVLTGLGAAGLVPLDKFFIRKSQILTQGFANKPVYWLRIPKHLTPDEASDIIVEKIQYILAQSNVT